jgi:hypothetical protein
MHDAIRNRFRRGFDGPVPWHVENVTKYVPGGEIEREGFTADLSG